MAARPEEQPKINDWFCATIAFNIVDETNTGISREEKESWELALMYGTVESFEEYLKEYPEGSNASQARKQIGRLQNIRIVHVAREIDKKTKDTELTHEAQLHLEANSVYLDSIKEVTYHLHRSFKNPNVKRTSSKDNFSLKILLWGEFDMSATILFEDGDTIKLDHELTLSVR